jgi:hypothetical protein
MRSGSLTAGGLGAVLVCAALLVACGGTDEEPQAERKVPKLASASVIDGDPYAIACGHVRDQQKWADVTRRATVAIGNRDRIPGLNSLQATQSVFYAMTELCEGRPASFEPAKPAVRAVRTGKYRADLGTP